MRLSHKQKLYKMKGCSNLKRNTKTKKNKNKSKRRKSLLGGADVTNLAYPYTGVHFVKPPIAFTGSATNNMKGGNDKSAAYPNTGPALRFSGANWLNSSALQYGGSKSKKRHHARSSKVRSQHGGNGLPYGQGLPEMKGIPYPNGLTGSEWGADLKWPATSNIVADNNHYALNTYNNDVSRQMIDLGANRPFLGGGRRRGMGIRKNPNKSKKRMNGGTNSNMFTQDILNTGREVQNGVVNTYRTFKGLEAKPSPLPWQDQFPNR